MSTFRTTLLRLTRHALSCLAIGLTAALIPGPPAASAEAIRQQEWPLDAGHFNAERIWAVTRGSGTVVAVVDSGVDATHPDLAGQVLAGTDEVADPVDAGQLDISPDSHGTAIAGIIAGTGAANGKQGMAGLAPEARILPVRVSTGSDVDPTALARGIIWAADHHAGVINISMGSPRPDPVLRKAVEYAQAKDAVIVASAGNSGTEGNPAMYPASFPGVVSVSGINQNNTFWPRSESGPHIALAAPATGIYSTNNQGQYLVADGTSYAAPYVAATAALIRSHEPKLTAGQVIRRLITTTRNHHEHPDTRMGYGILDPLAAVTATTDTASTDNPLLTPVAVASEPAKDAGPSTTVIAAGLASAAIAGAGVIVLWRRKGQSLRLGDVGAKPSHTAANAPKSAGKRPAAKPARPQRPRNKK